MIGYVFEAELSDDDKKRVIAGFYGPGELVRLADPEKSPEKVRVLVAAGGDLVVETVRVTQDRHVEYSFVGHNGSFAGGHFIDARDCRHFYGVVIREDDKTILVQLNGDSDSPVGADVFELSGDPEKYVAYNQGFPFEQDMIEYLETEGPFVGEFNVAPRADGTWSLVAIPWSANAVAKDIEAAREALSSSNRELTTTP
jgi:hypothetical protein